MFRTDRSACPTDSWIFFQMANRIPSVNLWENEGIATMICHCPLSALNLSSTPSRSLSDALGIIKVCHYVLEQPCTSGVAGMF